MGKAKTLNIPDLINDYDENFISSLSLSNISNSKELKELCNQLDKANTVVTSFYQTLYNDYIMSINSNTDIENAPDIDTVKKYKLISSKIQKAYSYILYMIMFENPFKSKK